MAPHVKRPALAASRQSVGIAVGNHPLANPVPEDFSLVPWEGVRIVAEVMTAALVNHDRDGWRKLPRREHIARAMRHAAAFMNGGSEEELRHFACRALMSLEATRSRP
jgi:hypothetical protein